MSVYVWIWGPFDCIHRSLYMDLNKGSYDIRNTSFYSIIGDIWSPQCNVNLIHPHIHTHTNERPWMDFMTLCEGGSCFVGFLHLLETWIGFPSAR